MEDEIKEKFNELLEEMRAEREAMDRQTHVLRKIAIILKARL